MRSFTYYLHGLEREVKIILEDNLSPTKARIHIFEHVLTKEERKQVTEFELIECTKDVHIF
jgi:hypothetical protein